MNSPAEYVSKQAARPAAPQQAVFGASSPPPASAAALHCQVPGCAVSLDGLATFYKRVRICEAHGKAYSITDASGRVMRFCQQCSRLQPLEMFSGDRRSCVASLDRRRQRRSLQAVSSRATSEASPSGEEAEWQLAQRKRRSSEGSPDADEAAELAGLSKRHSPMRACGSLTLSVDSLAEDHVLRGASSGRGGSLGSPVPSAAGWQGSSGVSEGAASGVVYAATTPASEDWQLGSHGSPLAPTALAGHAHSHTRPAGVRQPVSLVDLLHEAIAPCVSPPPQLPQQQGLAAGGPTDSVHSGLPPLAPQLGWQPGAAAQQLGWHGPPVHPTSPAAQPPQPVAQPAAPAVQQPMLAAQPGDDSDLGWALLDILEQAADEFCDDFIGDPSDILQELPAGLPPQQPAYAGLQGVGPSMPAAHLEAAAAAAAAALSMGSLEGPLADLAALGLSPKLPSSPTAPAGCVVQRSPAAAPPAGLQPSLRPAGSQDMQHQLQQAEQWQWQQLYELQQQVEQLQHAAGLPALSGAVGPPSPPPAAASAPAGSPAAAMRAWPPGQGSGMSAHPSSYHVEVSRVERRSL